MKIFKIVKKEKNLMKFSWKLVKQNVPFENLYTKSEFRTINLTAEGTAIPSLIYKP